jgi:hypothetical protein
MYAVPNYHRSQGRFLLQIKDKAFFFCFSIKQIDLVSTSSTRPRYITFEMSLPPGVVALGPDATCTLERCPIKWSVYKYRPSLASNGTFIALFALGSLIHAYLGIRWRTWWFMACMIVCSINACIGYAGRIWLYFNPFSFDAFLMQMSMSIQISLAPQSYSNHIT